MKKQKNSGFVEFCGGLKYIVEPPVKNNITEIVFILDNSGSMLIDNMLSDFYMKESKRYLIKESFWSIHKPDPFNLTTIGVDTKISLKAEYDTGINEYTIYNKDKYSLSAVFDEVAELITDDMVISVTIPRGKSNFIGVLHQCKNETLRSKLEKASKKK